MYKTITPILFLASFAFSCFAQCDISESPAQWQTDGVIYSTARIGNKLFIAGSFTKVSTVTGNTLAFPNFTTNSVPSLNFPVVNGTINAIVPDGQNGWIIGGSFNKIGNYSCNNLARVTSTYAVDVTWLPNVNSQVNTLAVHNGKLFAGGNFSSVNGIIRQRFAAFDLTTFTLSTLNFTLNGNVNHLLVANNILYIAGAFTHIAGTDIRYSLLRVDLSSETLLPPYQYINGAINRIAVAGNTAYIQGTFSQVFSQSRSQLAAFDLSGSIKTWNPAPNGTVLCMIANGTTLYVGGSFTNISGVSRSKLAAYDAATGTIKPWSPNVNDDVSQLFFDNARLYASGKFTGINLSERNAVAAFDTTTHALDSFTIGATNGDVLYTNVLNSTLLVNGNFSGYNIRNRTNLAAFDLTNMSVLPWQPNPANPSFTNIVSTLSVSGTTLLAGGSFASIAGQSRTNFAAFDSSGALLSFNPNIIGNRVNAIATGDQKIFIGGEFTSAAGSPCSNICAFDAATLTPVFTHLSSNGIVRTLSYQNKLLYAGGQFSLFNGFARNNAVCIETTSGTLTGWNPNPNNIVMNIHPYNSQVYLGGIFTQVNSTPRSYLAAVDSVSGTLLSWNPAPNALVQAISTFKDKLFIGGAFTNIAGTSRAYMATFDEGSKTLLSLQVTPDSWITTIHAFDSTLFVCGSYQQIDNKQRRGLSIYNLFEYRPSIPPSAARASGLSTSSVRLSWQRGNGNNYIVLARENGAVNANPLNNFAYTANPAFGSGSVLNTDNYVVYKGPDTTVVITGLQQTGTYSFAIFTFNAYSSCAIHNYTSATLGNVQLPVTWTGFTAERINEINVLKWNTSTEINNKEFEIERHNDLNQAWENIGAVKGAGTKKTPSIYVFNDMDPVSPQTRSIYYRLKQVDFNGRYTYSKTVAVDLPGIAGDNLSIHPSPVQSSLNVRVSGSFSFYHIVDASGRTVKKGNFGQAPINVSELVPGLYFLVLDDDAGKSCTKKFIKE